jgi:hypothetical protein
VAGDVKSSGLIVYTTSRRLHHHKMSRLTASSYRILTPMGGEVTETTDDIALGIRRDVENFLHQVGADQNVIDERHHIMAEIFTTDTKGQLEALFDMCQGAYDFILISNEPDGRARVRLNGVTPVAGIN